MVIASATAALASEPVVTLGRPYAVVDAAKKHYFAHDGARIAVKIDGKTLVIQRFGSGGLTPTSTTEYENFPKGHYVEAIVEHAGGLRLFYSLFDKKKETEELYSREIDMLTGTFKAPGVRVLAIEEKMDFWDEAVDNDGNAYILAKVREGDGQEEKKKEGKNEVPNYHAELLRLDGRATDFLISSLDFGDKFISSVGLFEGPGKAMVCAGTYNRGERAKSADGIFTVTVNATGSPGATAFHEIPLEVLQQNESARQARRAESKEEGGEAELESIRLRSLILDKAGNVTLIGEQAYVPKTQLASVGSPAPYVGGMSFADFHAGGDHYLVFLDNIHNLNLASDAQPKVHGDGAGGFLTAYKVNDTTGAVSRLSLLDTRGVQDVELFQIGVNRIVKLSESAFVMEAYKKKKEDILVKVTLTE